MAFECDKSGATYDDAHMKLRFFTALALTFTFLTTATGSHEFIVGGDRPVTVHLPYTLTNPAPLPSSEVYCWKLVELSIYFATLSH